MILTSVLINNYNNGPYLRACVDSALNQTHLADEVIVYDDGSSDESVSILRSYGNRIVLIEGARTGLGSRAAQANAVYQAFLRSKGDLIFLLDGDDCFHPTKIGEYLAAFEQHRDAACIQAPLQEIDPSGNLLGDNFNPMKHLPDYLEATYRRHDVDFYYPTSALAFSRSFLEAVLPLDYSDNIELALDTRLGMFAPLYGRVLTLTTPLSIWRRHPRSYTVMLLARTGQMNETLKRTRVFNRFCAERGFRPISLWRNRRFYLQVLRAMTPTFLYSFYYKYLRSSLASPAQTKIAL